MGAVGAYLATLALAVGLGLPLAVAFASHAQARAASAAVESIARQPEAAGDIRFSLILGLALIESLVIYVGVLHRRWQSTKSTRVRGKRHPRGQG